MPQKPINRSGYLATSLAVKSFSALLAASSGAKNRRFQVFDANGRLLARAGSPGTGEGQFDSPEGIAIDDEGNVYVVDTANDRVQVFSPVP